MLRSFWRKMHLFYCLYGKRKLFCFTYGACVHKPLSQGLGPPVCFAFRPLFMNRTRFNTMLLLAIQLTVVAIVAHQFIPAKRFVVTPSAEGSYYLHSTRLQDGSRAGSWLDESERKFRCVYPADAPVDYYCSFNQVHSASMVEGTDLSGYDRLNFLISYSGNSPKIRFFMRNYDERYSTPEDNNSTKYNTLYIPIRNLNRPSSVGLDQLKVAEWWLIVYNIPLEDSQVDLDNIINIGVDFSDFMSVGNHDVTIEKIEFVGEWISKEKWYLMILCCWLVGMSVYTVNQLRLLREKTIRDRFIISRLNKSNAILKKETDKFRRLSTVDPLTQVYNRFGIDQIVTALEAGLATGDDQSSSYSIVLMDLDFFKQVNDTHGHDAGDLVLRETANVIEKNLRHTDYLGRWGGEEFVVILPNTDQETALILAERLREAISQHVFQPEHRVAVTASFGVGARRAGEDFATTFKRVDNALYDAKVAGRNCCVLAK